MNVRGVCVQLNVKISIIWYMEVCLIGSSGYIGSCLSQSLERFRLTKISARLAVYEPEFVRRFKIIIYLGGKSTRLMKEDEIPLNVAEILSIAKMMTSTQLLIYTSTSAILEGHTGADENIQINEDLLDVYPRSMLEREKALRSLSIRSVGLRLGSVVGLSPKQRSDRLHIQMLKSALFTGRIHVYNPFSQRPILSMTDLTRCIDCLIENESLCGCGDIFNVASYNTTVQVVASNIAALTGAEIVYHESDQQKMSKGFSIATLKFEDRFSFRFTSTDTSIMAELQERRAELIQSWKNPIKKTIPCFVCGHTELMEMIDLGNQPLANQFCRNEVVCDVYPLAMYRCLNCQHNQLGYVVPPERLFTDYIYVTGTTQTMDIYCEQFCDKVSSGKSGSVLDIACNDGTQLDKFIKRGWRTYGVDPAKNLAPIASAKGHRVIVGFWGDPHVTAELKSNEKSLDIIIAQNVFAHVPDPTSFLLACKEVMSDDTYLYIQTSQAEIFQTGEFDTIYHEHLSYFTVKSMLALSERCGLYLATVEKVAVHGVSYIFTIRRSGQALSQSVRSAIEAEAVIYEDTNPIFYRSHAIEKKSILCSILSRCYRDGFALIGFGASAKGNTLLNFLGSCTPLPEYIIDENTRKQNLYAPGTHIPVVDYSKLVGETRPVAILVLAWNFLDEIKQKVVKARGQRVTLLIAPFPDPTLLLLKNGSWQELSTFRLPNELAVTKPRIKTLLVSHFYNEEFLLPYWIMHHAPMFDQVVLIDYNSTDRSRELIREIAPSHWRVLTSRNEFFDAHEADVEVRDVEKSYPDDMWKVTLNTTEFIVWPRMRAYLETVGAEVYALKIYCHTIVGDDTCPLNPDLPLVQQRSKYSLRLDYTRHIHRNTNNAGHLYTIGRHAIVIPSLPAMDAMLFKFYVSPWPELIPRKLQIAAKQSPQNVVAGLGYQHQWNKEQWEKVRLDILDSALSDIFTEGLRGDDTHLLRSKMLHRHLGLPWSSKVSTLAETHYRTRSILDIDAFLSAHAQARDTLVSESRDICLPTIDRAMTSTATGDHLAIAPTASSLRLSEAQEPISSILGLRVLYGKANAQTIDVTEKALIHFRNGNQLVMPNNDIGRALKFGDPLIGVYKDIIITINGQTITYPHNSHVNIQLPEQLCANHVPNPEAKLKAIHARIGPSFIGGSLLDEYAEQLMSVQFIDPNAKVLELGANVGRNTLVIASLLNDDTKLVTLDSDPNACRVLKRNRDTNNMHFHVVAAALSKRRLVQAFWNTIPSDTDIEGYTPVNTITYDALIEQFRIDFDTLVLDCEGAFYYILLDYPDVIKHVKQIIVENDYPTRQQKEEVDAILHKAGFIVVYSQPLLVPIKHACNDCFYEVWRR